MELHRLRYFAAVAEVEHFHRAAERLGIAQPALSRQIKLLEEELGTALFERLPRGVRLTKAGSEFLIDCRRILHDIAQAAERAKRVGRGQTGILRISFSEAGAGHGAFPETILAFRSAYPDVELVLQPLPSPAQVLGLRDDQFDAAFLYAPAAKDDPAIEMRPAQADHIVLAMPDTHDFAGRDSVFLRDLVNVPLIWRARALNPHYYDTLKSACIQRGLLPYVTQEVSENDVVLTLVAVGIGLGMVPASMRWRMYSGVTLRTIKDLNLSYQISLAWRRGNSSPILAEFIDVALRVIEQRNDDLPRQGPATTLRSRPYPPAACRG